MRLFTLFGIRVDLHITFLLLLGFYAYLGFQSGGPSGALRAVILVTLVFACVLLHELGHCLAARQRGIGVERILLFPFGGMAQFNRIPRSAADELYITIAGPAVNFILAGLFYGLLYSGLADTLPPNLAHPLAFLAWINLLLGLFNLLPVFPMDGGRILRALLSLRLSYLRATFWAVMVGKVLAAAGFVLALVYWQNYLLAGLLVFIFIVGEQEYRWVKYAEERRLQRDPDDERP
jgi:Zn-dependent protease